MFMENRELRIMTKTIVLIVLALCFLPSFSFGFDLLEYSPILSHYEVITSEDVVLLFDGSINAATVLPENVYLEPRDGGNPIDGALSLETTNVANDTIIFDPDQPLPFALPLRIVITSGLLDTGGNGFSGQWQKGDWFVPNIPLDLERPVWDPGDFTKVFINANVLLAFNPLDPESTDPAKPWEIPGIWATEAWKIHTGRPEIIIAAVDNGLSSYDDEDLIERFFINKGELPLPMEGTQLCFSYDCNNDGRFSVSDYADDPRVGAKANLNPMDLIEAFSNGIDDDGNGLADDICGWDFFRDANVALGVKEFREGTHATLSGRAACAIAGNGSGDKPGICPDCTLLPVRVSDAVIADLDLMAEGARYSVEMGAKVLMVALGAIDYSEEAMDVFYDAFEKDIITIAASGDELGFHHLYPASGEDIVSVHAALPIPPVYLGPIYAGAVGFLESYCTNFGAHISHTVSSGACTSEAVGNGAGLAGLIYSYALERGIELSAGEVAQIMNMSADDVKSHCLTIVPGGCKPGWDEHWGYGRVNAFEALKRLGWPEVGIDQRIPPDARITSPLWFENIDPFINSTLDIEGEIYARGANFNYEVQVAAGVEPDDSEFEVVGAGNGTQAQGVLASFSLWDIFTKEQVRARPTHHDQFTVTLRIQAWYDNGKGKVLGEARKAIAVHTDDDKETGLLDGFPVFMGASGEASPILYDLDGASDLRPEIIMATSNGLIHVMRYIADENGGGYEEAPGFPVVLPSDRPFPDGIVGTPAVGDLLGNGVPVIVAATFMGHIYAIWPDGNNHQGGPFLEGFPVSAAERPNDTPLSYGHGRSFLAAPVLSDLDNDGMLEIIAANYDQYVYAFKPVDKNNDGAADILSGWPVLARSDPGVVPDFKVCDYPLTASILGTPAVGILNPDAYDAHISDYPAVVVPTGEVCTGGLMITSRVYAIYHNGYDHPDGPFLPGWPSIVSDPFGDEIPIPPLTIGATTSPAIYRDDNQGKTFIGVGTFFWFPIMLVYQNGEVTPIQLFSSRLNMSVSANGAFGFMDDGDMPFYYVPTAGFLNKTDDVIYAESFNISGWRVGLWNRLAFRERLDDINFFVNPVIADIDSDGMAEVISGSSGYIVHAWNKDSEIPKGWPKFTQNWTIGAVAVGDMNVDGVTDIVNYTHEGNLFAWKTLGRACRPEGLNAQWWSFHHDEHNTGMYGVDTIPPGVVGDLKVYITEEPEVFEISFTSSGDDWQCGFAAIYDLRYSSDPKANLREVGVFDLATLAQSPVPQEAGAKITFKVKAPGAKIFAIRAQDETGNIGLIGAIAQPETPGDDDDFADDDDISDDDVAASDDDDDQGCCGI